MKVSQYERTTPHGYIESSLRVLGWFVSTANGLRIVLHILIFSSQFKWNVHMWYLAVHMAVGKWLRWVHKSHDSVYFVLVPLILEVTSHVTCWLMAVSCCCCCPLKPWVIWAGSLPGRQQTQSEQWHTKKSTNQSPRTNNVSSALAFGIPLNISPVQNASCYLEEKIWD